MDPNDESSRSVQFVWTLIKDGNTGMDGPFPNVISRILQTEDMNNSSLHVQTGQIKKLLAFIEKKGYVEHPTTLCQALGMSLTCYAKPYKHADEHHGKNNILATFLTCNAMTGLAPNTIIGRAVFIRRNATGRVSTAQNNENTHSFSNSGKGFRLRVAYYITACRKMTRILDGSQIRSTLGWGSGKTKKFQ